MSEPRLIRLFRNCRNEAVRIQSNSTPGDAAIMRRVGDRLAIEPARERGLISLIKAMKPIEKCLPGTRKKKQAARINGNAP